MQNLLAHFVFKHPSSKEWITFIHGAGGSSRIWYKQLDFFKERFNVLMVDLRGHGESAYDSTIKRSDYTFDEITNDVVNVLDELKIQSSHFAGISLGTIISRHLAEKNPTRVKSLILAGAILKFDIKAKFLIKLAALTKNILPFMFLYKILAFIILPRKNHRKSRYVFIREAKKICQTEFLRWFKLNIEVHKLLRLHRNTENTIPFLYLMGDQDYLFLKGVKETLKKTSNNQLIVVPNCGHVVNIEKAEAFNLAAEQFIHKNSD